MRRPTHLLKRQTSGRAFGEDVQLLRSSAGDDNEHGEWVAGALGEPESIRAASSPLPGRMRDQLPAGVRLEDVRRFWATDLDIIATGQDPRRDGDLVIHNGTTYRVFRVQPWQHLREFWGVREDPQP